MNIRKLENHEIEEALELTWISFMHTEADFYTEEGIKQFYNAIHEKELIESLEFYGAFISTLLIGIIATRDNGKHIALFFVAPKFQGHGVGRQLFNHLINVSNCTEYTVNSSHFARDVYRKFGFKDTAGEQKSDGIIYTPMLLKCA